MKTYGINLSSWKKVRLSKEAEEKLCLEPGFYKVGHSSDNKGKAKFILKTGFGIRGSRANDCMYFTRSVSPQKVADVKKELRKAGYLTVR